MRDEQPSEAGGTGISFATWQDRQLSIILSRTDQLLRELRAAMDGRHEALSQEMARIAAVLQVREEELAKTSAVLEVREGEVRDLSRQKAALESKAESLAVKLHEVTAARADLTAREKRLREEVDRLQAVEKNFTQENQALSWRASSSAVEAGNLRRQVAELQSSLSWKITAPLRFLTRPLFQMMGRPAAAPPVQASAAPVETAAPKPKHEGTITVFNTEATRTPGPIDAILPELRRAQSIAIIPCAIPFSSTLNQRPISCARYLADHGTTVLYVAWQWQPDEEVPQAWQEVYPRVFHIPLFGFLNNVESIAAASYAKGSYLSTLPSPALVDAVKPLRAAGYHIHYDIMDDWEGFHAGGEAPWFSAAVEHEMVILADTVSAVSTRLVEKFDRLRGDIALVHNGYQPAALECEQFIAARSPLPARKVVGYFGHFSDAWFYWDTVIYAAGQRPDVDFELIGWGISEQTQKRLNALPNIRPVGIVRQGELHRYARNWWLGMIPFQPTAVSAAVDPLKVYEYLHLGLPSVVTGISGIAKYPLVQYAESREAFVAAIDRVTARPDEATLAQVAEFLKDCVWEERFRKLSGMLAEPAGLAYLYARAGLDAVTPRHPSV